MTIVVLPAAALSNAFSTIACPKRLWPRPAVRWAGSRLSPWRSQSIVFCPPESKNPRSPTRVLYPSGNDVTKPSAFALIHASLTTVMFSSSLAFSNGVPVGPISTFSRIDMGNRTGSCETSPICDRNHLTLTSLMSVWSNSTAPLDGSCNRSMRR